MSKPDVFMEPRNYTLVQSEDGCFIGLHAETFWRNRPELWFRKIEAQLSNCNIDNDTQKFNVLVSLLDEKTALEVKDIIVDPPDFDKYDCLKEQLLKRVTAKNEEEAKKKMIAEPMGDRKPSEFYRDLNMLAGCYVRDDFVEQVWFECLPSKIRAVVECLKEYTIDTQAKIADRIYEVFLSQPTEQCLAQPNTPAATSIMENLVKEVENLNKKVQMLKPRGTPCKPRSKGQRASEQCDGPPSKPQKNVTTQIQTKQNNPCHYHTKYGVKLCKMRKLY